MAEAPPVDSRHVVGHQDALDDVSDDVSSRTAAHADGDDRLTVRSADGPVDTDQPRGRPEAGDGEAHPAGLLTDRPYGGAECDGI